MRHLLLLLTMLAGRAGLAEPGILLLPALGRTDQVTVHGRVLKEAPTSGSSAVSRNLRRLMAPNWVGAPVELSFEGQTTRCTSGHDGAFEATFAMARERPLAAGLHGVQAKVPGALAKAPIELVADDAPFIVISDFDDTLAVTRVLDARELVNNALLKDGDTQAAVTGMSALLRCLRSDKASPPGFALVSGSPVQYAGRIATFLQLNRFPFFGLYLRDLGPGTLANYKQPVIRSLLKQLPHPAVLVGDSGERDPEVYAQIRDELPGRVRRIYIRNAGHAEEPARFNDMVLFSRPIEAARDAVEQGLATRTCVERELGEAL